MEMTKISRRWTRDVIGDRRIDYNMLISLENLYKLAVKYHVYNAIMLGKKIELPGSSYASEAIRPMIIPENPAKSMRAVVEMVHKYLEKARNKPGVREEMVRTSMGIDEVSAIHMYVEDYMCKIVETLVIIRDTNGEDVLKSSNLVNAILLVRDYGITLYSKLADLHHTFKKWYR